MHQIIPKLYVGDDTDCPDFGEVVYTDMYVVHAAKDRCHRRAVGYKGRALDRNHPSYLWHETPDNLYLNLIDAPSSDFIPGKLMDDAVNKIQEQLTQGKTVLIHCNQGTSRSPALALLYLNRFTDLVDHQDHAHAIQQFMEIYPDYAPGPGIDSYLRIAWAIEAEKRDAT